MQNAIVEYTDALTLSHTFLGALERKRPRIVALLMMGEICRGFREEAADLLKKSWARLSRAAARAEGSVAAALRPPLIYCVLSACLQILG